jgi:ABC-type phosphate/phosphonate transport system substrate-binding protein
MRASLPMYDLPETRAATDSFWAALAKELGVSVPLERGEDWTHAWRQPDLLFSQTCGYPLTHEFAGKLTYVATPHYDADGCEGPFYCSILMAREKRALQEFRGSRAAFNNRDSMSGMLALKAAVVDIADGARFFSTALETGGHIASLMAVQNGHADICAIDCVTIALLRKHRPSALAGLVEIGRTQQMPGLPFVTHAIEPNLLREVLATVLRSRQGAPWQQTLLLRGVSVLDSQAYQSILLVEESITNKGGVNLWSD